MLSLLYWAYTLLDLYHQDLKTENQLLFLLIKLKKELKLREFIQKNSENNLKRKEKKRKEKKRDGTKEKTL